MNCPKCKTQYSPEQEHVCPACGLVFAKYDEQMKDQKLSKFINLNAVINQIGESKFLKLLVAFIPLLAVGLISFYIIPEDLAEEKEVMVNNILLEAVDVKLPNSCAGKDICVSVYIAPWSKTSKLSIPTINQLSQSLQNHPFIGFKVVLGGDQKENLIQFSKGINSALYIDSHDKFTTHLNITTVPTWVVYDKEGYLLSKKEGVLELDSHFEIYKVLSKNFELEFENSRNLASESNQ